MISQWECNTKRIKLFSKPSFVIKVFLNILINLRKVDTCM